MASTPAHHPTAGRDAPTERWHIYHAHEFAAHRAAWRELNERSLRSPVLDPDFVEPLLAIFGGNNERLAICGDSARPRAMALLLARKPGVWQTFQPDQAPIGPWLMERDAEFEPLMRSLLRQLPGVGLLAGVTQQDPLLLDRPHDTTHLRCLDYIRTVRVPVDGNFEAYWAKRGKNLRHNMKRLRNRLAKENRSTALDILQSPSDMAGAVADYGRMESSGWKSSAGTAVHPDNPQGRFYTEMLARFAARGQALVFRYRMDGQVVAMDLCIVHDGTLVILKTTYDETHAPYSPALLMREEAFQWIFRREDIRAIEFYGRMMEWHTKWADDVRTMYHVNFYRWALLPKLFRRASAQTSAAKAEPKEDSAAPAPDAQGPA